MYYNNGMEELEYYIKIFAEQYSITPKEAEIVMLLCKGMDTNANIAEKLNIAVATLDVHLNNIFRKTNKNQRHQVIALVFEMAIIHNRTLNQKKNIAAKKNKNK